MSEPISVQFHGEITLTPEAARALGEIIRAAVSDRLVPAVEARLVKAPEACDILGVSRSTLYELMKREEVPALHLGRSLRFRTDLLEEYMRRQSDISVSPMMALAGCDGSHLPTRRNGPAVSPF